MSAARSDACAARSVVRPAPEDASDVIRVFSAWLAIARTCAIGDPDASVIRFSTRTRSVVRAISASYGVVVVALDRRLHHRRDHIVQTRQSGIDRVLFDQSRGARGFEQVRDREVGSHERRCDHVEHQAGVAREQLPTALVA